MNNQGLKKIELKNMVGAFYYGLDVIDNACYNLFDENKNYISSFYAPTQAKLKDKINRISEIYDIACLVDLGFCLNISWGYSLEELYEQFLDLCNYDDEEYTYEEFLENVPINVVGKTYFIVDLEYF